MSDALCSKIVSFLLNCEREEGTAGIMADSAVQLEVRKQPICRGACRQKGRTERVHVDQDRKQIERE